MKQPKFQRRAEDRPREICAAALEVFAEKGFASAKLDEIAKRAGVSKGTLYLYFADKEQLFRAVIRDAVVPNVERLRAALIQAGLPFGDLVRLFFSNFVEVTARVPIGAVAKMVISESGNFPELAKVWHDEVVSKAIGTMTALIEMAQAKGEVRAGDARLHTFSLLGPMLMGILYRQTLEPIGGEPLDLGELAKQHVETVLDGLLIGQPA
ncbi:TetR/AcrR family transcriptional regulator [Sphingomonas sp. RB56-2]|uniref:TetR/AcrR family transcriptional regulator n=1 Tax=Sphingomonas brevis TaxID=2908206 RepID=A0ABT0S6I1_9SPHN|nr:TetR/AcrR family transcriptional regulator [Sphingomonas brevis]